MAASQVTVALQPRVSLWCLHGAGHVLCTVWPGRLGRETPSLLPVDLEPPGTLVKK